RAIGELLRNAWPCAPLRAQSPNAVGLGHCGVSFMSQRRSHARSHSRSPATVSHSCLSEDLCRLAFRQRAVAKWLRVSGLEFGLEAGIRTPITWSRATCPTVERPPSMDGSNRQGRNPDVIKAARQRSSTGSSLLGGPSRGSTRPLAERRPCPHLARWREC